ncbi:MAG: zinc-binding alcohol dehydrogenase family protein [Burkholderiales bacterium]
MLKAALPSVDAAGIHWEVRDIAEPEVGQRQLLIRARASSINRGEATLLRTKFQEQGAPVPATNVGGIDAAGEIVAIGAEVQRFKPGDRVAGRCAGGFSERVVMNEFEAIAIPSALDDVAAACLPVSFVVAHDALVVQANPTPGHCVLITGVSSAVGVAALGIAKFLGAKVIGTSGSADKLARLTPLGLDLPIRTRAPDFAAAVKHATDGRGADIAIDLVGAVLFEEILQSLAVDGRFATIGQLTGPPKVALDMDFFAMRRLHLFGVSNRLRTPEARARSAQQFSADLMDALVSKKIRVLVDRTFPLDEISAAHRYVYADQQVGKVVITI